MLRICAWCKRQIGADGQPQGEIPAPLLAVLPPAVVTHGICTECQAEQMRTLGLKKD